MKKGCGCIGISITALVLGIVLTVYAVGDDRSGFSQGERLPTDVYLDQLWQSRDSTARLYTMTSEEKILGTAAFWYQLEVYGRGDTVYWFASDIEEYVRFEEGKGAYVLRDTTGAALEECVRGLREE